ncbi:MFS transporter [Actinoplanes sp. RD1]|uniref:MFS transporter n=1 Tax=Actinoplanes sp. RD1 TaxID=3064538 RepID=UPI002741DF55|nr:MFS transporter [Actinoplanes sp. RD1]
MRSRVGPLLTAMFVLNVFGYAAVGGVLQILLPTQVREAAGDGATSALALITGVSAIASLAVPPIAGLLSDRTSSRWGRRAPWILGGGVATAAALVLLGLAGSVPGLLVGWFLVQATINIGLNIILSAIPERIPARRHGLASTVQGLGLPVGAILGVQLGAAFAGSVAVGYVLLAVLFAVASALCAFLVRDPHGDRQAVERRTPAAGLRTMFGSLRFHDYRWVFISRAVLYLGYNMISGFGLYILQDHIRLPADLTAAEAVATSGTINLVLVTLGTVVSGPLADRFGHHRAFVVASSLLLTVSMVVPLAWPSWPAYLVQAAIGGFALGAFLGVDLALATIVLPRTGDAGRDLGVFHIALNAPQVIAPFLASVAVNSLGGYPALFLSAGAIALLGSLTVLRVRSGTVTDNKEAVTDDQEMVQV